ncbi:MAG: Crp/Fnr family transcriptional regulator [bacterium]
MSLDSPFARKLSTFVTLSGNDLTVLSDLHRRRRRFLSGRDMMSQGEANQAAYILASGWVCYYVLLRNGAKQIVEIQVPGDFLGLRSVLFRTSDQSITTITEVEASEVLARDLLDAFSSTPRLATAVLWAASRDQAMMAEHLVGMGRRDAAQRLAHFILELAARLILVGQGSKSRFACPLTQYQLADVLGISAVHVNRVLRELRVAGMMTFRDGHVTFEDFDRLVVYADFDIAYLDHGGPLLR